MRARLLLLEEKTVRKGGRLKGTPRDQNLNYQYKLKVLFVCFGCTHSMWNFLGQGSNLCCATAVN